MPILQTAGTVASVRTTTSGWTVLKVWEKLQFNGQDKFVLWTCWFDNAEMTGTFQEHDEVIIEGRLSTKIETYTDKTGQERTVVGHHLNDSRIITHRPKNHEPDPLRTSSESLFPNDETPF